MFFGKENRCAGRSRRLLECIAAFVTAGMVAATCGPAAHAATPPPPVTPAKNQFFDYFINNTPSYIPSPVLTNSSAHAVDEFLQDQTGIRAVKVMQPISNQTANLIFNNSKYHVSYVLGDFETNSAPQRIKTLAQQVRFINGQNNGTKSR